MLSFNMFGLVAVISISCTTNALASKNHAHTHYEKRHDTRWPNSTDSTPSYSSSASSNPLSKVLPSGSNTSAVLSTANYTTSTVYKTLTHTITSCAPTVTNCPVGSVTTKKVPLYTTVYPLDSAPNYTTSTVYTTKVNTITSCAPTVTNCPVGSATTETIALYTTVCPVTPTESKGTSPSLGAPPAAQPTTAYITSTAYTTILQTITSCAPKVTNCPAESTTVITKTSALYTTICPVTHTGSKVEETMTIRVTQMKTVLTTVYATTTHYLTRGQSRLRSTVTVTGSPQSTQIVHVYYRPGYSQSNETTLVISTSSKARSSISSVPTKSISNSPVEGTQTRNSYPEIVPASSSVEIVKVASAVTNAPLPVTSTSASGSSMVAIPPYQAPGSEGIPSFPMAPEIPASTAPVPQSNPTLSKNPEYPPSNTHPALLSTLFSAPSAPSALASSNPQPPAPKSPTAPALASPSVLAPSALPPLALESPGSYPHSPVVLTSLAGTAGLKAQATGNMAMSSNPAKASATLVVTSGTGSSTRESKSLVALVATALVGILGVMI